MRRNGSMHRLSLWVPTVIYDRLNNDSQNYGITKTSIVQTAIINYYRGVDSGASASLLDVSRGKAAPAADTP